MSGDRETRAKEGGNAFGVTVGVQMVILAKSGEPNSQRARAHYADLTYLSLADKLSYLNSVGFPGDLKSGIEWDIALSDYRGDWLEQGNPNFPNHLPIGDVETKMKGVGESLFSLYSSGIITSMDEFVVNSDFETVLENSIDISESFNTLLDTDGSPPTSKTKQQFWYKGLRDRLEAQQKKAPEQRLHTSVTAQDIRLIMFRPWLPQYTLWHKTFNWSHYRLNDIYDSIQPSLRNTGKSSSETKFSAINSEEERGGARRSEEERGGARRSEEERGGARRSEEERGGARRSEEERGGARRSLCISGVGSQEFTVLITSTPVDRNFLSAGAQCFPRYRLSKIDSAVRSGNTDIFQSIDDNIATRASVHRQFGGVPPLPSANPQQHPRGYL